MDRNNVLKIILKAKGLVDKLRRIHGLDNVEEFKNTASTKSNRLARSCLTRLTFISYLVVLNASFAQAAAPHLKLSSDKHLFMQDNGAPFFWLADDAWALHNRLSLRDAEQYLDTRKSQGFTVIHSWLAASWMKSNRNGDEPFLGSLNNTKPIQLNQNFFNHLGKVIDLAEDRDLYFVLEIGQVLRTNIREWWIGGFGSHQQHMNKAYEYGWRLAQTLKKNGQTRSNLFWGLGQDTHPERGNRVGESNAANKAAKYKDLVTAMAEGVADGTNNLPVNSYDGQADYSTTLMSFHVGATGPDRVASGDPSSSSEWFHDYSWLDYNSHQSGRRDRFIKQVHQLTDEDYNRSPVKPTLETEASYEGAIIHGESGNNRYSSYHARLHGYWSVFAGAFGHQYGNINVWQFYDPSLYEARADANQHWSNAVNAEGARQMQHLRNLIESRPFYTRTPDQSVLLSSIEQGGEHTRLQALRASDGSYAFIYSTNGRSFDVDLNKISGSVVDAWWYDPRTGNAEFISSYTQKGAQSFIPPGSTSSWNSTNGNDWVLVLDDASRNFGAPGTPYREDNPPNPEPDPKPEPDPAPFPGDCPVSPAPGQTVFNACYNMLGYTKPFSSDEKRDIKACRAACENTSPSPAPAPNPNPEPDPEPSGSCPANPAPRQTIFNACYNMLGYTKPFSSDEKRDIKACQAACENTSPSPAPAPKPNPEPDPEPSGSCPVNPAPGQTVFNACYNMLGYTKPFSSAEKRDIKACRAACENTSTPIVPDPQLVPPPEPSTAAFIMAHRGGAAEAPENTLAAFEKVLALGVNIEMDVHLSKDNVIVVIHKDSVDRTTNGTGFVNELTLTQLKALDAGSHFGPDYRGEQIPTLEEVFALFKRVAVDATILSIDTHGENATMYDGLIALLEKYQLFERVYIEVSNSRVGNALRARDGRIKLAFWAPNQSALDEALRYPHYERIHTRVSMAGRASDVHEAGKKIIISAHNQSDWQTIRNRDIDGINTDSPEYMQSLIGD